MNRNVWLIIGVAGAAMAGWMLRPVPHSEQKPAGAPSGAAPAGTRAAMAGNPPAVRPDAVPSAQTDAASGLEQRLAKLEATVAQMQAALDGISIEKASADRLALFTAEEGYLKADEYFEAGKFAIAGEGYLAFLQKYPTHPDSRDIMKKARDAFWRAGYKDKSLWVQDEMMKAFPGHQAEDIMEQAKLEKEAGRLDKAIEHAAEAAALAKNPEEALWNKLYWAWYVQLRDGNQAGINAVQQVQQQIASSGVSNPRLAEKAAQHLSDFQNQLTRTGR